MIILICYENKLDDYDNFVDDTPQPDIYTYETDNLEVVLKDIEKEGLTEKYEHIEVCIVERTIKSEIVKPQYKDMTPPMLEEEKELDKLSMEKWFKQLKELQERK